jgi:hypothetical protein
VPEQTTTRWQELAAARWPSKPITGSGHLAVVTVGEVRLFQRIPMYQPGSDFDEWTSLLVSDKQNRLVDLRTVRAPVPPKVEPKPKVEHVITFRHKMDTEKD